MGRDRDRRGRWVCLLSRLVIFGYVALTGNSSNPQAVLREAANGAGLEFAALLLAHDWAVMGGFMRGEPLGPATGRASLSRRS